MCQAQHLGSYSLPNSGCVIMLQLRIRWLHLKIRYGPCSRKSRYSFYPVSKVSVSLRQFHCWYNWRWTFSAFQQDRRAESSFIAGCLNSLLQVWPNHTERGGVDLLSCAQMCVKHDFRRLTFSLALKFVQHGKIVVPLSCVNVPARFPKTSNQ